MSEETFNERTEAFYRETRIWPPGRDMPAALGGESIEDVRLLAYDYWRKTRVRLAQVEAAAEAAVPAAGQMWRWQQEITNREFRLHGPLTSGSYVGQWEMMRADGERFGIIDTKTLMRACVRSPEASEAAKDD